MATVALSNVARAAPKNARTFAAVAEASYPAHVLGAPAPVVSTTSSGLKIGSVSYPGETATVTAWVDAGSRYETPQTNGVAHLMETAALQAKSAEIAALGGQVTGYTSREHIVFEAKVLKENVAAATSLMGGLLTTVGDVAAAKGSIECALAGAAQAPEEVIMEHLHDAAYLDSRMGMSVLGTAETVGSLQADDVTAYMAQNVTAGRTTITAAGAVDPAAFSAAAEAALGSLPATTGAVEAVMEPATFTGSDVRMRLDSIPAAHVAFGFQTEGYGSKYAVPLMMMETLLGEFDPSSGAIAMNNKTSKLSIDLGDQGAATAFKVFNLTYKDTGLFGAYLSCPDNKCEDAMWYTLHNMVRLAHKTTDGEVEFAKTALKAKLVAQQGTNSGVAGDLAGSLSNYGRAVSLAETFARIDSVSAADIRETAFKFINDQDHALAGVGQIFELPDYNWIRRRSYWLRY